MNAVCEKPKTFNDFARLQKCVADLIRCRSYLDQKAQDDLDSLESLARKMEVSAIVQQRNMIAVAGMQGTGKSTLIKNLYELPDNFLRVNSSRGEQVPVFITERSDLADGKYSARRVYFDEKLCRQEEEISPREVGKYSKGSEHTAYVELFVPYRYFHTENAGFVLLPGFEKDRKQEFDQDYNSLMEYTLYFANAVLLVTDGDSLANYDITVLLDNLGKNFSPRNCAFAITFCDGRSDKDCKQQTKTLFETCNNCGLPISSDHIVCTGEYRTEAENTAWKEQLIDVINDRLDFFSTKKEYLYFRPMMDEISSLADQMGTMLNIVQFTMEDESPLYADLKQELSKAETQLERYLDAACAKAQAEVADRFSRIYGAIPNKHKTSKKFLVFKKSYSEMAADRRMIQKRALSALDHPRSGHNELIYQIAAALPESVFYKGAQNHLQLLEEAGNAIAQNAPGELQLQRAALCRTAARGYLDAGADLEFQDIPFHQISSLIATELNTYFLSAVVGNIDLTTVPLRTEGIQATIGKLDKMGANRTNIAPLIGLADLLDGECDIARVVVDLFVKNPEKAAEIAAFIGGAAIIAVALVAVGKKSLDLYNQSIERQNAVGEAWEYALKNVVQEQRNNLMDSFCEASEKLLEHVQRVHQERCGIDAKRSRIAAAKYALANIAALSNSFNDKYASILENKPQNA